MATTPPEIQLQGEENTPARVHLTRRHASSEYIPTTSSQKTKGNLFRRISMPLGDDDYTSCLCHRQSSRNPIILPPSAIVPAHQQLHQFAKIRSDLLIAENVCEILQNSQKSLSFKVRPSHGNGNGPQITVKARAEGWQRARLTRMRARTRSKVGVCQQRSRSGSPLQMVRHIALSLAEEE